ncbi:MAG TPA: RluA family pseudouridine synthase [Myxococcales bacterium]
MRRPARLKLAARAADEGTPLLRFVAVRGGISEELARAAILRGGAFLRGKRERDPEKRVSGKDLVEVDLREPVQAELGKERILHLDAQLIAVDKPAGLSAQEERGGGPSLPDLCSKLAGGPALLVHRLDRGTTGVTVLARTRAAQATLLEAFRERRARKEYRALVSGAPPGEQGSIDLPIAGAAALTRFRLLESFAGAALISALPETGRTHQVRIHLRELGCPLLGDARYGGPMLLTRPDGRRIDFQRPMLHALSLELGGLRLRAPLPPDFESALAFLRR